MNSGQDPIVALAEASEWNAKHQAKIERLEADLARKTAEARAFFTEGARLGGQVLDLEAEVKQWICAASDRKRELADAEAETHVLRAANAGEEWARKSVLSLRVDDLEDRLKRCSCNPGLLSRWDELRGMIDDRDAEVERLREKLNRHAAESDMDWRSLAEEAAVELTDLRSRLASPTIVELGDLREVHLTRYEDGEWLVFGAKIENSGIYADTPQAAVDALVEKLKEERDE